MYNNDLKVISQATTSHKLLYLWRFIPIDSLLINDLDIGCKMGEVRYDHPGFEMGTCLYMKGWVFALERNTEANIKLIEIVTGDVNPQRWMLSAFHSDYHYNFDWVPSSENMEIAMIRSVLGRFLPMLHPEIFSEYLEGNKDVIDPPPFPLNFKVVRD